MNVQELSHDEYMAGLRCEIQTDGLIEALKKRLDDINQVALLLNYKDWGVVQEKSSEIIDLLKMQEEPRVLALEEIHRGMAVWLEDVDKADVILAIGGSSAGGAKCFITEKDMSITPKDAEYGIRWRAWTQKPTDAQREATRWGHICGPDYCEL